jgi:hypothetical protein
MRHFGFNLKGQRREWQTGNANKDRRQQMHRI